VNILFFSLKIKLRNDKLSKLNDELFVSFTSVIQFVIYFKIRSVSFIVCLKKIKFIINSVELQLIY